jgi:hypothetical protein
VLTRRPLVILVVGSLLTTGLAVSLAWPTSCTAVEGDPNGVHMLVRIHGPRFAQLVTGHSAACRTAAIVPLSALAIVIAATSIAFSIVRRPSAD